MSEDQTTKKEDKKVVVNQEFVDAVVMSLKSTLTLRGVLAVGAIIGTQFMMNQNQNHRIRLVEMGQARLDAALQQRTASRFTQTDADALKAGLESDIDAIKPQLTNLQLTVRNQMQTLEIRLLKSQVHYLSTTGAKTTP